MTRTASRYVAAASVLKQFLSPIVCDNLEFFGVKEISIAVKNEESQTFLFWWLQRKLRPLVVQYFTTSALEKHGWFKK